MQKCDVSYLALHGNKYKNVAFSDVVIFSADMAKCVRQSLAMLMRDGDRRQELVQEMIITNNQLR